MESLARAAEILIALGFAILLAAKVRSQRRLGERSIVLDPRPLVALGEAAAIAALFTWIVLLAVHGLGFGASLFGPRLFRSALASVAGIALAPAALVWTARAWHDMGAAWRIGIDRNAPPRLVERGLYARSRHPIYVGIDALALSAFFLAGTLFHAASTVVILVAVHLRMLHEERWLARVHGEAWARYRARVRRYL